MRPHFSAATVAQCFYVAAQAGIFAYFINTMTSQPPVVISNATASTLASVGFLCFLAGRFLGAALVKKFRADRVLGIYGAAGVALCAVIMLKLGWVSVGAVFGASFPCRSCFRRFLLWVSPGSAPVPSVPPPTS